MTYKVLIVDDEPANLRLLERLFSREYQCLTASNGTDAIRLLEQHDVAIIITDQRMPQMTGIELLKQTAPLRPHMVRILLTGYTDVEALVEAINSGLVYMYFTKPWNNEDLRLKVSRALEHYENNKKTHSLLLTNQRLIHRLNQIKNSVSHGLADMVRSRDTQTYDHAVRVRNCALAIADKMKLSASDQDDVATAALLHDLGQLGVTGSRCSFHLMSQEMCNQAEAQLRLLSSVSELSPVADIVTLINENFDGTGHPNGLRNEQIPIGARIVRVADEYDSILRPHHSNAAMTHDEAMRFLSQRSQKQFDPVVIEVLQELGPDVIVGGSEGQFTYEESECRTFSDDKFEPSFVDSMMG